MRMPEAQENVTHLENWLSRALGDFSRGVGSFLGKEKKNRSFFFPASAQRVVLTPSRRSEEEHASERFPSQGVHEPLQKNN